MPQSLNDVMAAWSGRSASSRLDKGGYRVAEKISLSPATRRELLKLLRVLWRLNASLVAMALLSACGANAVDSDPTSTSRPAATATATTTVAPPSPATKTWVSLEVGDCIAEIPRVDLGEVSVTLVDCATPHKAEMYFRAGIPVNAALDDVADQQCGAAFPRYTGQSLPDGPLAMTYLIDSNQDRTVIDPTTGPAPSNVICLLEDANGQPLTGSARR
jgi:hypothetical protein